MPKMKDIALDGSAPLHFLALVEEEMTYANRNTTDRAFQLESFSNVVG